MQKPSVGRRIWDFLGPMVVYMVVSNVVSFIGVMIMYIMKLPEFLDSGVIHQMQDSEAFVQSVMEFVQEVYMGVLQYATEMTGAAALISIPIFIWMRKKDRTRFVEEDWKAPLGKYFWILPISIPVSVGLNNLLTLSNIAMIDPAYQQVAELLYTPALWVQIVCVVILAPLAEEYLFRGLIYNRLRKYTRYPWAIVWSALAFGIYHGNLVQGIYGFMCGLLLAWLYERYNSLKASVLAHMFLNLCAVLLTEFQVMEWIFADLTRVAIITIGCALLGSVAFLTVRKATARQ